jgi:excisionase family DNA binding protein
VPTAEKRAVARRAEQQFIPDPAPPLDLLTSEEVWTLLRISRPSWFRLQREGRGPKPIRLGRSIRFRRQEIDRWLAALQREAVK